ncbi:MAG: hypothetical protein WBW53_24010 [Terriglobales bacterium]
MLPLDVADANAIENAAASVEREFGPIDAQVQVEELADDFIREYRINGRKSLEDADTRWNSHLKPFFGVLRAVDVTSELIGTWTLGSDRGPQMRQ